MRTEIKYEGTFDVESADGPISDEFSVMIYPADQARVEAILLQQAEKEAQDIDPGYYLLTYTDAELREVLSDPDAWSKYDYVVARKLLRQRGHPLTDAALKKMQVHTKAIKDARQRRSDKLLWLGYAAVVAGGIGAIIIGNRLIEGSHTSASSRTARYNLQDRKDGRNLIVMGIGSLIMWIAMAYYLLQTQP